MTMRTGTKTYAERIGETTGGSGGIRAFHYHILAAFLAFLKLEWECIEKAISWY